MTFSILAYDAETGRYGAAAATGSLCVGGWVLRGTLGSGLSASQGTSPSTLWGETVLSRMKDGQPAEDAVRDTVAEDAGKAYRQLSALDPSGRTAAFTGDDSTPAFGHRAARNVIVAGNMLKAESVLDAVLDSFLGSTGPMDRRLLDALTAGDAAGSDSRGLMSAALLMLGPEMPPLSLRIDCSDTPLADLRSLHARATTGLYAEWTRLVPTARHPARYPTAEDFDRLAAPPDPEGAAATPIVNTD